MAKKLSDYDDNPLDYSKKLDSYKKISSQFQNLVPSEVVTLYEIDVENLLIDQHIPHTSKDKVFRIFNKYL